MKTRIASVLLIILAVLFIPAGCRKIDWINHSDDHNPIPPVFVSGEVPLAWLNLAITLARTTPGFTGPVTSRSFGYIGLALYESVVPELKDYKSIQKQLNGLPTLPKPDKYKYNIYAVSANAALATMVHNMYGNASAAQNFTIDSLQNVFDLKFKSYISTADFDRSAKFGKDIANAIYDWSKTDGGDKGYLNVFPPGYTIPTGPGLWTPLPGQGAQHAFWGTNRTFVAGNTANFSIKEPPAYSIDPNSDYYKEELEVYNESINQDPEHRTIALYWAAIPPPTVSISILSAVLKDQKASLAKAAESYCRLGMAISDAFIVCYKAKYKYSQERPISYIRANFNSTWSPLIGTPPFPDYLSAHSVQTGAAATVLAGIFGNNTTFTDYSINDLGFTPRTFTKFSDYAYEVGLSRIYGGIHIRSSDFIGLDQGTLIGENIMDLHFGH